MIGVELEDAIDNAIERTLTTKEDIEAAKEYFGDQLVSDMIDRALREF